MKRMKKVLSIVLSLAMILTSITIYDAKTTKAAGICTFKTGQIDRAEFIAGVNQINVVFSWDRENYPSARYTYKVYNIDESETNPIISNDGAWEQGRVPFGKDIYNFRVDVCDKENNNEVVSTETFEWTSPDNTACDIEVSTGKKAFLSWKPISNAARYSVSVDGSIFKDDLTSVTYECELIPNVDHLIEVNAYDVDGNVITITKNTATAKIETKTEDLKTAVQKDSIVLTGEEKWVAFSGTTVTNNATVYVEEDTLNKIITNDGLRGLYNKGSDGQNWNNITLAAISDLPVLAFVKTTGNVTITDEAGEGYEYTDPTDKTNVEVWRGGGDCIYINQNIIDAKPGEEKVFSVSFTDGSSFLIKVVGEEKKEDFNATVDGNKIETTNNTITLPATAFCGYYCNGKMYKSGSIVELKEDMAFTSVNTLDLSITNGAAIRLVTGETGIRYKASIISDNKEAVNSDAIKEGILITTDDNYNNIDDNIKLESQKVLNVANISTTDQKWYSEKNDTEGKEYGGTFCGSIINMIDSNIRRPFVARAYATITYEGETEPTVIYTDVIGKKSIKDIAKLIQETEKYISKRYSDVEIGIIDGFANYTDEQ